MCHTDHRVGTVVGARAPWRGQVFSRRRRRNWSPGCATPLGRTVRPPGRGCPPTPPRRPIAPRWPSWVTRPDPTCLRRFDTGEHFGTWQGEDGVSVTTNAHVLEAFGRCLRRRRPGRGTGAAPAHRLADRPPTRRRSMGGPLARLAPTTPPTAWCSHCGSTAVRRPSAALRRAVSWVLENQRTAESWGRWQARRLPPTACWCCWQCRRHPRLVTQRPPLLAVCPQCKTGPLRI